MPQHSISRTTSCGCASVGNGRSSRSSVPGAESTAASIVSDTPRLLELGRARRLRGGGRAARAGPRADRTLPEPVDRRQRKGEREKDDRGEEDERGERIHLRRDPVLDLRIDVDRQRIVAADDEDGDL